MEKIVSKKHDNTELIKIVVIPGYRLTDFFAFGLNCSGTQKRKISLAFFFVLFSCAFVRTAIAQNTQIRGFADVNTMAGKDGLSWSLGEQDLFITSTINDRLSFLGETIFRFSATSSTKFSASVERIILNYILYGNHSLIAGKIHTPVNYWNDSYHHGRVFFPTIDRPLVFDSTIIPLHSLGLGLQGKDLGRFRFGYNVFLANGLGSGEIADNDRYKSLTVATYIRPARNMRIGISWYHDKISEGALVHSMKYSRNTTQNLYSASLANFGKHWEILLESTAGLEKDNLESRTTIATYGYLGYRIKDKLIPYGRYDFLRSHGGENHLNRPDVEKLVLGVRYQINYLAVMKLEYQNIRRMGAADENKVVAQFAVGF